jgi:hypothetical protein
LAQNVLTARRVVAEIEPVAGTVERGLQCLLNGAPSGAGMRRLRRIDISSSTVNPKFANSVIRRLSSSDAPGSRFIIASFVGQHDRRSVPMLSSQFQGHPVLPYCEGIIGSVRPESSQKLQVAVLHDNLGSRPKSITTSST